MASLSQSIKALLWSDGLPPSGFDIFGYGTFLASQHLQWPQPTRELAFLRLAGGHIMAYSKRTVHKKHNSLRRNRVECGHCLQLSQHSSGGHISRGNAAIMENYASKLHPPKHFFVLFLLPHSAVSFLPEPRQWPYYTDNQIGDSSHTIIIDLLGIEREHSVDCRRT